MEKQLLTARDVANALGHKGTGHVYALIRAGELPAVKVGSRGVRIPRQAFEEHIERLNQSARASLNVEKFAGIWSKAMAESGSALAAALAPSAEAIARSKSEMDGFNLYLQNSAPRR